MFRDTVLLATLTMTLTGCAAAGKYSPLAPLERKMIFQPAEFPAALEGRPLPFETAEFLSSDGSRLHGWFVDHPDPVAVALFCHGNAGNIVSRGDTLLLLNRRHRLAVMTFDYRGYGKSEGTPTEQGILDDARAARRWLAERKGIPENQIVMMGRSLGGAVAVDLAARDDARGLVLANTFASLPSVAKAAFPLLPTSWIMTMRMDSLQKMPSYHGPLLQSHGDSDQLIPIEQARQLFAAAPGPKRFVVNPGGGHNDPQSEEYRLALDEFLRALR